MTRAQIKRADISELMSTSADWTKGFRAGFAGSPAPNASPSSTRAAEFMRGWRVGDEARQEIRPRQMICGACGEPWHDGLSCGQKDNGWTFRTCYPAEAAAA